MTLDFTFRLDRFLQLLGLALLLVAVPFLLFVSEFQDRALTQEIQAREFWQWKAGADIKRGALVVGLDLRGCVEFELDDPFPLGARTLECDEHVSNHARIGQRVRLTIRSWRIEAVELLD